MKKLLVSWCVIAHAVRTHGQIGGFNIYRVVRQPQDEGIEPSLQPASRECIFVARVVASDFASDATAAAMIMWYYP